MPTFLFHGENNYLAAQKINLWRKEFAKKYDGDTNISILEGDKLTASQILNECETMPFLSEKRLIIVKNFLRDGKTEEQKLLAEKLESLPDFSILAFVEDTATDKRLTLYKRLIKIGQTEEFFPFLGSQLSSWIIKQTQKKGSSISLKNAEYLPAVLGNNLWKLEQEISKLALFAKNREITNSDIDKLTSASLTSSIFKLTDFLGLKQTKGALQTLHTLIDSGEDLFMIFHMIIRHFRNIIQMRDLLDRKTASKEITKILKLHPFVVINGLKQAKNFDLNKLKSIYQALLEIEISLKNSQIKITVDDHREFKLALDKFIINCAE